MKIRVLSLVFLFFAAIFTGGCTTTKRTVTGVGYTIYGAGSGLVKDTTDTVSWLDKADKWFQENYW